MVRRRTVILGFAAALGAGVPSAFGVQPSSTVLVSLPTGFTAPFDGVNESVCWGGSRDQHGWALRRLHVVRRRARPCNG